MPQVSSATTLVFNGVTNITHNGTTFLWGSNRWLSHVDFWSDNSATLTVLFTGENTMLGNFHAGGNMRMVFNDLAAGGGRVINSLMLLSSGASSVVLNRVDVGALATGQGNDTVTVTGSAYAQFINTGDGADVVNISTTAGVGVVNLGNGTNRAIVGATGSAMAIFGGDGADVILANGNVGQISSGDGNDIIHVNNANVQNISAGRGNDVVQINVANNVATVDLGDGNNNLTVLNNGGGVTSVIAYGGNDKAVLYSHVGSVNLGHGNNLVQLYGSATAEFITLGSGVDTVQILGTASVGTLNTGEGGDIVGFNSSGGIQFVHLGNGNNIFRAQNVDSYIGSLVAGGDNDFLQVLGEAAYIDAGRGNDRLETGTQYIGTIDMGRGNDTLTLGSGGAELVMLGRDADTIILNPVADKSHVTTIYGGRNTSTPEDRDFDMVVMSSFTSDLIIDLYDGYADSADGDLFDIYDFEGVTGGSGNDLIYDNDAANLLNGGAGNDTIRSFVGADTLDGGAGDDVLDASYNYDGVTLLGGAGNDTISGSSGTDSINGGTGDDLIYLTGGGDTVTGGGGADTFYVWDYDSDTATLITDFSRAQGDVIDFTAFGQLAFIGTGAFSGSGNEIRYQTNGGVTRVLVDFDGDSAVDLTIELTGALSLVESDLILA